MAEPIEVDETFAAIPEPVDPEPELEADDEAQAKPEKPLRASAKFRPEFIEQARKLCQQFGATHDELIEFFAVSRRTFYYWKRKYPAFSAAMKVGSAISCEMVASSLYQRARGYEYDSEKVFLGKDGKAVRVPIKVHVPQDVRAAELYLTNKDPENWRVRREITGAEGKPLVPYDGNELARRLVACLDPRFVAATSTSH